MCVFTVERRAAEIKNRFPLLHINDGKSKAFSSTAGMNFTLRGSAQGWKSHAIYFHSQLVRPPELHNLQKNKATNINKSYLRYRLIRAWIRISCHHAAFSTAELWNLLLQYLSTLSPASAAASVRSFIVLHNVSTHINPRARTITSLPFYLFTAFKMHTVTNRLTEIQR